MINTYRYSFFLGDESIHFTPAILMPGLCHERPPVRADLRSADLSVDPSRPGLQILEATDLLLRERTLFTDGHVVLFQVGCSAKGRENYILYPLKAKAKSCFLRNVTADWVYDNDIIYIYIHRCNRLQLDK